MKPKSTLLSATLGATVVFATTAFAAEERQPDAQAGRAEAIKAGKSETKKPLKRDSDMEEKTTTPKVMQLRDWEELFGHKHTEGEANMPMPESASGVDKQETMQPIQKHDVQEKH